MFSKRKINFFSIKVYVLTICFVLKLATASKQKWKTQRSINLIYLFVVFKNQFLDMFIKDPTKYGSYIEACGKTYLISGGRKVQYLFI